MTTTPHKHHDVIVAWARGETIQRKCSVNGKERWDDVGFDEIPQFLDYVEYRLKPSEPVRKYPETTMTGKALWAIYETSKDEIRLSVPLRAVANAALRHAIDSGQVVSREEHDRAVRNARGELMVGGTLLARRF